MLASFGYAHPEPTSFAGALKDAGVKALPEVLRASLQQWGARLEDVANGGGR